MFTLIAFNEAVDAAGVFYNIKGAADQHVHVEGDVIYVPDFATKVLSASAQIYDGTRAYLLSPSLRKMGVFPISPSNNIQTLWDANHPVKRDMYRGDSPISLIAGEGLEAFAKTNVDTTKFVSISVLLGDAPVSPVKGEIWTVRTTTALITTEESKWKNGEITFDETLPVGRYQVVGAQCWAVYGTLFRLVPVGARNRPGGLCTGGHGQWGPLHQRAGRMGVWCEFHSTTPPSLDLLGRETRDPEDVSLYLDLIKIA